MKRKILVISGAAAVLLLGSSVGIASAVGTSQPVSCDYASGTLTCPIPSSTTTVTSTKTITAAPVTTTITATRVGPTTAPQALVGSFVDCVSGSDGNTGTQSSPWKTLVPVGQKTFPAGSHIYLAAGCTFTNVELTLHGTGTAVAPIVVDAYGTGAAPVLQSAATRYTVTLSGAYQTLQNVKVINGHGPAVEVIGSHDTVAYCEFANDGEGVEVMPSGDHALVTHNNTHDLHMIVNTVGGNGDDFGAVGYVIWASDVTVSFNQCVNCIAPSDDFGVDGGFVEVWETGTNLRVHANYANNVDGFSEIGGDSNGTNANNMLFDDNSIVDAAAAVKIHTTDSSAIPTSNLQFINNTFYQSRTLTDDIWWNPGAVVARNNIFYVSTYRSLGTAPGIHTNNLYYDGGSTTPGYALGANEKVGNPLFMVNGSDFHLQAGSPARALGVSITGSTTDYNGQTLKSPPDAGAMQF